MKQPSPQQFLEACGVPTPLQVEVERPDQHETIRTTLSLPFALVGRDERADLPLDDARVSLRHAYLQVVAGRLWWVDLDSRRGTHGSQGRQTTGLLDAGQRLRIVSFHVRLLSGCLPDEAEPLTLRNPLSRDSYDLSLPRVCLEFWEGTAGPQWWTVDRSLMLVGRASYCKVRLNSPLVSRTHCALLHTPAGLWVIDLLGREGVHVNGTAVRWALLEDADELRIGSFRIRVNSPTAPRRETPSARCVETKGAPSATSTVPSRTFGETLPAELGNLFSSVVGLAPTSSTVVPTGVETNESVLLPFITQFSLMQQQMFDQFQQALTMMVHLFSGLHRDQMQLIRQEMNHLQELTRELQGLPAELARHTSVSSRNAGAAPSPRPTAPVFPIAPPAAGAALPTLPRSSPPRPIPSAEPKSSPLSPTPAQSDAEVHAWLSQRLMVLQQERQSRWQKILSVLTGKRAEQAVL
ncbi:MAG TPA: FHA domain-containing protein [Gemmataceae bacterium]